MAAHLLELMWQRPLIEKLVPVLDPGNSEWAARHQANHPWIGCAGAFGRFDQLARMESLFAFRDVAQARLGIGFLP
jgi:hypothetical protein